MTTTKQNIGKEAKTIYKLVKELEFNRQLFLNLIECTLETGRTHQIRVHCQHSGLPIVGDGKYGDVFFNKTMVEFDIKRMFLHASKLKFKHPEQDFFIDVTAPLPVDLKNGLELLNDEKE